jgi:hypothetical protein
MGIWELRIKEVQSLGMQNWGRRKIGDHWRNSRITIPEFLF